MNEDFNKTINKFHIDLDNDAILRRVIDRVNSSKDEFEELYNRSAGVSNNLYYNWFDKEESYIPHKWPEVSPIVPKILEYCGDFKIRESSYNLCRKGSYITEHIHRWPTKMVAIYYVAILPEHPEVEFQFEEDSEWIKYPCIPGDCLVFHHKLPHRMKEQLIDEHRSCIVFHIGNPLDESPYQY
jgi:hypothetical protein